MLKIKKISNNVELVLVSLLLFAVAVIMSLNSLPSGTERGYDREIFRYIGMVIANGGMPYLDAFDHKPPGIYLIAALMHGFGARGHWFFETFLLISAVLCFYFFLKKEKVPFAWFFPFLFTLYIRTDPFYSDFLTRGFSSVFSVLAISFLGISFRLHFLVAGIFYAAVFFTQQNDVLALLPFFFYFLWRTDKTKCVRRIFEFTVGLSVVIVPVLFWLIVKQSFSDFLYQAFIFNMKIYSSPQNGFWGKFTAGFHSLKPHGFLNPMILAAGLFVTGTLVTRTYYLLFTVFTAIAAAIFALSMSAAYFEHYYLSLMPYIALLFAYAFREFSVAIQKMDYGKFLLLFLAWYIYFISPVITPSKRLRLLKEQGGVIRPAYQALAGPRMTELLEPLRGIRGSFFAFREPAQIALHTDFNVIAPTKYIYTHFWEQIPQHWDANGSRFLEILSGLDKYRPKVIIDYSEDRPLPGRWQQQWLAYRDQYYRRHSKLGRVFIRKEK